MKYGRKINNRYERLNLRFSRKRKINLPVFAVVSDSTALIVKIADLEHEHTMPAK